MNRLLRIVLALGATALCLFLTAAPASAHPLGNFTVNRYTGVLISPDGVKVDHVVDLAEIPTSQLGTAIDDLPALAERECAATAEGLEVTSAGTVIALTVESSDASTKPGQAGLPITRITCEYIGDTQIEAGEITINDRTAPGSVGWREITAVGNEMTLTSSNVPAVSTSNRLISYPKDLLTSPLDVTSATLVVSSGGPPGVLPGTSDSGPTEAPGGNWLSDKFTAKVTSLLAESGWLAAGLALIAASALGATHALSPGHGKTVMAFYLTQRGDNSLRSALAVGSAVTAAHTGSVLLLGLLVSISSAFVPARLYPYLTLSTGLIIIGLGVYLLVRLRADGGVGHGHGHGHGHGTQVEEQVEEHAHVLADVPSREHAHAEVHPHPQEPTHAEVHAAVHPREHGHDDHGHGHGHTSVEKQGDQAHAHPHAAGPTGAVAVADSPADPASPGRWGVWVMGLVGGLVPSPSALLLFLAAVAVGRAWFGFVLVLAFGVGMAGTLAAAGLLARGLVLRVESLAARRGFLGGNVRTFLRYGAALGICAVGTGVVIRTLLRF